MRADKIIAERLKQARLKAELSQERLAVAASIVTCKAAFHPALLKPPIAVRNFPIKHGDYTGTYGAHSRRPVF